MARLLDENDLLELKKQIDQAKAKESELKGQLDLLMKQLKKDWGCKSIDEAKAKIEELEQEAKDLAKQIQEGIETIQKQMEE